MGKKIINPLLDVINKSMNLINSFMVAPAFDSDALAFIAAASITDNDHKNAINTLVSGLKAANIWDKMKAIYPFIGGDAFKHRWNLKDPRDLSAAYRLIFTGGITHDAGGITPNGSTGYAQTYFTISASGLTFPKVGLSYYSTTNSEKASETVMGAYHFGSGEARLVIRRPTNTAYSSFNRNVGTRTISVHEVTDSRGLFLAQRIGNGDDDIKFYKNGSIVVASSYSASSTDTAQCTQPIALFAFNNNGTINQFTDKKCAFAAIHDSLSDSEVSAMYTIVQQYQTALGRNV